jgi:cytochrome oxidase Cu insertion factor (SCO1/SenC/PrrC family)
MKSRNSILFKITIAFLFAFFLAHGSSRAQLGPKDAGTFQPTELDRIKVGETAPDFTLEDAEGKPISLSDYRGKKSVVLVFYRGYW